MVYITDDGNIVQSTPLGLRRVLGFFTGIIYMIIMFFQTLISPNMNRADSQYTRDYRPGSGYPPSRRIGRPNTGNTGNNIPFFGACQSCTR